MQERSQKLVSNTEIMSEESSEFYRMNEFTRIFLGQLILILNLDLNEIMRKFKIYWFTHKTISLFQFICFSLSFDVVLQ